MYNIIPEVISRLGNKGDISEEDRAHIAFWLGELVALRKQISEGKLFRLPSGTVYDEEAKKNA